MAEPTAQNRAERTSAHRWKFVRAGGFDQVLIETGSDLKAIPSLDPKLWVALSCPVRGIEFDPKTLSMVDTDGDGHLRVPEIRAAVRWACSLIKDPDLLVRREGRIPLSSIDDGTEEGIRLVAAARRILAILGKPGAQEITVEDAEDTDGILAKTRFNGDGVVPPGAVEDPALRPVAEDAIACLGGTEDRSGLPGVTAGTIETFYAEAAALSEWYAAAEGPGPILPFGEDTERLHGLHSSVKPKIDDFFLRGRLAAYDPRAEPALNPPESEYGKLSARDLGEALPEVERLPLAAVGPGRSLPLGEGLNPAWAGRMARYRDEVVTPLLGERTALSGGDWEILKSRFAPHEAWRAQKPRTSVERLGLPRLRELLAANGKEALLTLVEKDLAAREETDAIGSVARLVRYCRDLHALVNNFVSFGDFYSRKGKATFQAGTLYLDGRSLDLCLSVEDAGRHAALANAGRVYLVYCDCVRRGGGERRTIAAAFTGGDSDFLTVGRNGVFFDRGGADFDATIVRIVEHPISVRQAFWGPYKRIARMLGEQFQKIAASRAKAAEERAGAAVLAKGEEAASGKPPAAPPPFDVGKFAGIFAAIGLAVGAIGTAVVAVVSGLFGLTPWQVPLVLAGAVLLVSGPSMILAWSKLRQRNLAPLLDANGWAVNARARLNLPFGASLTTLARIPEGAERRMDDPFAEKRRSWTLPLLLLALATALFLLWRAGYLARWTGGS